jgi:hypothetical protein
MKSNKRIGLICLTALLVTVLALPVTVSASPGLTLIKYKPSSNATGGGLTVTNPTQAYDWLNGTNANFKPGEVASGYFVVKDFVVASGYTAPPEDRRIAFVDVCMIQSGGASGKGYYRVLFQISGAATVLVDWTQTSYGSATTLVWPGQLDPGSAAWDWDRLAKIEFYVDTKIVGSGGTSAFNEWEVWINVYYYRQSTLSVQTPSGKQRTPFTVNITVADVDSLYSWEFELSYNNTYLTATDVVNGTFFPIGNHPHFWKLEVNDAAGRVRAACSLIGDVAGQDGSGVLAKVYFNVKAPIPPEPQVLDLKVTKLVGYDYANKRTVSMVHLAVDGTVLLSIRDVNVLSVTPEVTVAYQGYPRDIEVRVKNEGDLTETFNVTLYYGSYKIGDPQKVTALAPGSTQILTWTWDTTGIPYGVYAISAVADQVPYETNTGNNVGSGGNIILTIAGDITGPESPPGSGKYPPDGTVNNLDLVYLNNKFGTTDPLADITSNGLVDIRDLYALGRNFGKSV